MKTATILAAVLSTVSLNAAVIQQVIVRQQWPWSTDIKVEYKLAEVTSPVDISVKAFNGNVELDNSKLVESITGDLYGISESGIGQFIIDPVKAFGNQKVAIADFRVELELSDSAANIGEVLYKIYDLEGGGCTDVTRADLLNGRYGAIETNYTAFTGFNTPVSDVLIWTDVTNDVKYATTHLVLRKIPAKGQSFTMGAPTSEKGSNDRATVTTGGTVSGIQMLNGTNSAAYGFQQQHTVSFTNDFYMGVFEVSQYQYWKIKSTWPSFYSLEECRNTRPVECVPYSTIRGSLSAANEWPSNITYYVDSASFLGKLRAKLSGSPKLDLPTEAQWEYACRAKSTTAWYCGSNPQYTTSNYTPPDFSKIARYNMNGGSLDNGTRSASSAEGAILGTTNGTARVGSYLPNAYGLYDMIGNVGEWVLDYWGPYQADAVTEPLGATRDTASFSATYGWLQRVLRGSCHWSYPANMRSASREHDTHSQGGRDKGFRLCLTVKE